MTEFISLIDEHHEPSLRETIGHLLSTAGTADIAIAHLRLAGLDLTPSEAGRLQRCRVLLGHLDASVLFDAGPSGESVRDRLRILVGFANSGRLEMRTAPHHSWNPDFSIFRGLPADRAVTLVGAHYFGRPYPLFGLALTCVLENASAVRKAEHRFEQLWEAGYDILPVVTDTVERLAG